MSPKTQKPRARRALLHEQQAIVQQRRRWRRLQDTDAPQSDGEIGYVVEQALGGAFQAIAWVLRENAEAASKRWAMPRQKKARGRLEG